MRTTSRKSTLLALAAISALGLATSASAQAFSNGSFETGTDPGGFTTLAAGDSTSIPGWVVGGDSVDYIGTYWQAQDGSRSIDLSGGAPGSVSQTFDTAIGQAYLVSFWLAGNPDGGSSAKLAITSATGADPLFSTFVVPDGTTRDAMGWQSYAYWFTATGASTTLSFASGTGDAYGPALDNVSVEAVPEPATWGLMVLGFGGLGAALRRRNSRRVATAA